MQYETFRGTAPIRPALPQFKASDYVKVNADGSLTIDTVNKINSIKAVREITGLGLKESKDIVDNYCKIHGTLTGEIKRKEARAKMEKSVEERISNLIYTVGEEWLSNDREVSYYGARFDIVAKIREVLNKAV